MDYDLNIKHRNILKLSYFDKDNKLNFKNTITYLSDLSTNDIHLYKNISVNNTFISDYIKTYNISCNNILSEFILTTSNITTNNVITDNFTVSNKLSVTDSIHQDIIINGNIVTSNVIVDSIKTNLITSSSLFITSNNIIFGNENSIINIYGYKSSIIMDDFKITDKFFDINKNKTTLSAIDLGNNSGIEIKNINSDDGYIKTDINASNFLFKLPERLATHALTVDLNNNLITNINILNYTDVKLYGKCIINNNSFIKNVTVNSSIVNNNFNANNIICNNNLNINTLLSTVNLACKDIYITNNGIIDKNFTVNNILHNISNNTFFNKTSIRDNIYANSIYTNSVTCINVLCDNTKINTNFTVVNTLSANNIYVSENITGYNNIFTNNIVNKDFNISGNLNINDNIETRNNLTINSRVTFNGKLYVTHISEYISNASANQAGILDGQLYRTGGILKIKVPI